MHKFNVSYEIVTQESAEYGDADERGFISELVPLRDAVSDLFDTRTCHVDRVTCIEASSSCLHGGDWITVTNGMEFLTGAYESRSLHFPRNITKASATRLARLLGAQA